MTPPPHAIGALPANPLKNRKAMKALEVGARAQPILNPRRPMFPPWRTHFRPYISDNGARNNGPSAKDSKKMLRYIAMIVGLVTLYFSARSGRPGAIIELDSGDTKV